jgi:dihydroorotase
MKIRIANGRLVDPGNGIDRTDDLYIAAGKVIAIGAAPDGFQANRVIDAAGLTVAAGLVDLSARLREPGFEYKATLESEMLAAVAGGVTSLACPPDTEPPLDEPGLVAMLKHRAKSLGGARIYPVGALTMGLRGERVTEMAELRDAGCIAFSQAHVPLRDANVMLRALQYAATFGFCVWLHPLEATLAKGGVAHDGEVATRLGLPAIPVCAETVALATILLLAKETEAPLHFTCISSRDAIEMLREARARGIRFTCDTTINHLHLCEVDVGLFDSHSHLSPPLRSREDRDALAAALARGEIDCLCSDHTPVDEDAKQLPFAQSEPGAGGLELLLPATLKWAQEKKIPIREALAKITINPARVMGIEGGELSVGRPADICIFDPERTWTVTPRALRSQGKNTPFLDWKLRGQVRYTLVEGRVVYEASPE